MSPWRTQSRSVLAACAMGEEPSPASLENMPRRKPQLTQAPSPASGAKAPRRMPPRTPGRLPRKAHITARQAAIYARLIPGTSSAATFPSRFAPPSSTAQARSAVTIPTAGSKPPPTGTPSASMSVRAAEHISPDCTALPMPQAERAPAAENT